MTRRQSKQMVYYQHHDSYDLQKITVKDLLFQVAYESQDCWDDIIPEGIEVDYRWQNIKLKNIPKVVNDFSKWFYEATYDDGSGIYESIDLYMTKNCMIAKLEELRETRYNILNAVSLDPADESNQYQETFEIKRTDGSTCTCDGLTLTMMQIEIEQGISKIEEGLLL